MGTGSLTLAKALPYSLRLTCVYLQQSHAEFARAKTHSQAGCAREAKLRELAVGYDNFMELKNNIEEGMRVRTHVCTDIFLPNLRIVIRRNPSVKISLLFFFVAFPYPVYFDRLPVFTCEVH